MRRVSLVLAGLIVVAPSAHASSLVPLNVVFMGCVQSSANCVKATLTRDPSGIWQYFIISTFDPGGGWIFSFNLVDTKLQPNDDFQFFSEGPHFLGPAMPVDSVRNELLFQPNFWIPTQLDIFLMEPGRNSIVLTPDGTAVDEVKTKECREALAGQRAGGGGR